MSGGNRKSNCGVTAEVIRILPQRDKTDFLFTYSGSYLHLSSKIFFHPITILEHSRSLDASIAFIRVSSSVKPSDNISREI